MSYPMCVWVWQALVRWLASQLRFFRWLLLRGVSHSCGWNANITSRSKCSRAVLPRVVSLAILYNWWLMTSRGSRPAWEKSVGWISVQFSDLVWPRAYPFPEVEITKCWRYDVVCRAWHCKKIIRAYQGIFWSTISKILTIILLRI